jgi:type I restriction enzyme S subunit
VSFPRYAKYRDSGVAWLGEIPAHWEIKTVRRLCTVQKRIAGALGYDVLSITQQGIKIKNTNSNDGQLSMDYSKYQLVDVGDFAMNHMDLLTGWVDISAVAGVTSPDYRVFSVSDSNVSEPRFLLYLFQMGYRNRIFFAYGQGSSHLGRWRLPAQEFNELPFPTPPKREQRRVAAFLDRETAKIDALIAEQQRLIELLKEKRQAVISHAVTKGLNPDAPIKPSGIEWRGDVPEHWEVKPLKHVVSIDNSGSYGTEPDGAEVTLPVATTAQIDREGRFHVSDMPARGFSQPEVDRYGCRDGDLLIVKSSGSATNIISGKVGLVDASTPRFVFSNFLMRVRPKQEWINPKFLLLLLKSHLTRQRVERMCSTTTYPNLDVGEYTSALLPFPPIAEQGSIVLFVEQEIASFNNLSNCSGPTARLG